MENEKLIEIAVVRSNLSGVWMGHVESCDYATGTVQLRDAYRLWQWRTPGLACSSIAVWGVLEGTWVEPPVSRATIFGVSEILEATPEALATVVALTPYRVKP